MSSEASFASTSSSLTFRGSSSDMCAHAVKEHNQNQAERSGQVHDARSYGDSVIIGVQPESIRRNGRVVGNRRRNNGRQKARGETDRDHRAQSGTRLMSNHRSQ